MGSVMDELLTFSFSSDVQKDLPIGKEIDEIFFNLIKYTETGDIAYLEKERQRQGGAKGNVEANDVVSSSRKKRQKEAAPLADITENVIQSDNIIVKKEKISIIAQSDSVSTISDSSVKDVAIEVKKEAEEMPAPRKLPPRKKNIKAEPAEVPKRSTRTRTKPRKYDEFGAETDRGKQSDIIIQNTTITTIDITEDKSSDTENISKKVVNQNSGTELAKEKPVLESMRSTRSKMRQVKKTTPVEEVIDIQASESAEPEVKKIRSTRTKTLKKNKRNRSDSSDGEKVEEKKESKKSKSNSSSEAEVNKTSQTEYEDAISTLETNEPELQTADATYVASVDPIKPILNQTVVLETHKTIEKPDKNIQMEETKKAKDKDARTPPKPKSKKKTKEIFSPFEKTPVKKKVEAFERLQCEASNIPIKTKTRMPSEDGNNRISGKPKAFTPFASKFLPKTCSTSKINKMHPGKLDMSTIGSDSMLSMKSLSALKASQAEFKEREKRRQEKEREALKKREALLQAQTEEKRRRREEKQLKAQQQREIIEKEKQKLLEEHKRKEEKYKQAIAEREEKLQKQKEESDKKRLLVKKKAELIKEKEERLKEKEERSNEQKDENELARQIQKQRMQKAQLGALPIYMTSKAPLLPTEDCYDSDDSDYSPTNRRIPDWARGRELEKKLITIEVAGQKMKNTLFCRHTYSPDLQEIFVYIDPKKLKRTSSAIWRKPPRYTLFTGAHNIHFSEDSEDEIDI